MPSVLGTAQRRLLDGTAASARASSVRPSESASTAAPSTLLPPPLDRCACARAAASEALPRARSSAARA